jgi:hypothetical protein
MPQAQVWAGFHLELFGFWHKTGFMTAATSLNASTARLGRMSARVDLGLVLGLRLITP